MFDKELVVDILKNIVWSIEQIMKKVIKKILDDLGK